MKKRAGEKLPPLAPAANAPRKRKLNAAIESVFRLTHGREMTADERRLFGVSERDISDNKDGDSRPMQRQVSQRKRVDAASEPTAE